MSDSLSWTSGTAEVNGLRLAYTRTGEGTGLPVLVLLHGVTDAGACWSRVAAALSDRFDILMPDARGHGRSARLPGPIDTGILAADTAALLDELRITGALVWGHSMGALTGLALAASRPDLVRSLVMEDPPLAAAAPPKEMVDAIRASASVWSALPQEERHARAAEANPGWDPAEIGPWVEAKVMADPAVTDSMAALQDWDWVSGLARLRCPGLLLTGEPGLAIVTPDLAAEALSHWPAGRQLHVPGAGHNIHRDRWTETTSGVFAFLESNRG
jgi:pimeloyl-ACP methyl ester carboxylesterase